MLSRTEIERLAAMANALRPDWPAKSVATTIATHLTHRAYRDVAVALAYVACDPTTQYPNRVLEAGDWWNVTRVTGTTGNGSDLRPDEPRCPVHERERARHCRSCASERIEAPERTEATPEPVSDAYITGPALARTAMREHGIPTTDRSA